MVVHDSSWFLVVLDVFLSILADANQAMNIIMPYCSVGSTRTQVFEARGPGALDMVRLAHHGHPPMLWNPGNPTWLAGKAMI